MDRNYCISLAQLNCLQRYTGATWRQQPMGKHPFRDVSCCITCRKIFVMCLLLYNAANAKLLMLTVTALRLHGTHCLCLQSFHTSKLHLFDNI